jgi:hypothetical protein
VGKRKNLKKRDNEGEGADLSDCTSNADTNFKIRGLDKTVNKTEFE